MAVFGRRRRPRCAQAPPWAYAVPMSKRAHASLRVCERSNVCVCVCVPSVVMLSAFLSLGGILLVLCHLSVSFRLQPRARRIFPGGWAWRAISHTEFVGCCMLL